LHSSCCPIRLTLRLSAAGFVLRLQLALTFTLSCLSAHLNNMEALQQQLSGNVPLVT